MSNPAAPSITDPTVKGTGIKAMLRFVEQKAGPDALKRVLARLPAEDQKILASPILPSSRYPEAFDHRIILAIFDEVFKGDIERGVDLGRAVFDEGMNIFSRLFMKVGDPSFLISKAGVVWNQYHQVGRLEVFDVEPKAARAKILDYPLLDIQFCRCLLGSMIRALEVSGCQGIRIDHEKCVGRRDPYCQYRISWL